MTPSLLFRRSYWVIPGRFVADAYPGSSLPPEAEARAEALAVRGITLRVSLMFPIERDNHGNEFRPYEPALAAPAAARGRVCRCVCFPIVDGGVPSLAEMIAAIQQLRGVAREFADGMSRRGYSENEQFKDSAIRKDAGRASPSARNCDLKALGQSRPLKHAFGSR